ncbi:hypothetical protein Esti_002838 [Eimeria stiedai]
MHSHPPSSASDFSAWEEQLTSQELPASIALHWPQQWVPPPVAFIAQNSWLAGSSTHDLASGTPSGQFQQAGYSEMGFVTFSPSSGEIGEYLIEEDEEAAVLSAGKGEGIRIGTASEEGCSETSVSGDESGKRRKARRRVHGKATSFLWFPFPPTLSRAAPCYDTFKLRSGVEVKIPHAPKPSPPNTRPFYKLSVVPPSAIDREFYVKRAFSPRDPCRARKAPADWYSRRVDAVPVEYRMPLLLDKPKTRRQALHSSRMSKTLKLLKRRQRPSEEELVKLKQEVFNRSTAPIIFLKSEWDSCRDADEGHKNQ